MNIATLLSGITDKQKSASEICLHYSVTVIKFLALQGIAFRGHDENMEVTLNGGNFLELHQTLRQKVEELVMLGRIALEMLSMSHLTLRNKSAKLSLILSSNIF